MTGRVVAGSLLLLAASVAASALTATLVATSTEALAEPPPDTSAVDASLPVVKERLERTLVFQAEVVRRTHPLAVTGIVSAIPSAGSSILPGDVLVEVNGRPVIAYRIPFPFWRDLSPGDSGRDVEALQKALSDLGLRESDPDGIYGPETQKSVLDLYDIAGYEPPEKVGIAEVEAATSAAELAAVALDQARAADRASPGYEAGIAAAEEALATARVDLRRAQRVSGVPLPLNEVAAVPHEGSRLVMDGIAVGDRLGDGLAATVQSTVAELVIADSGAMSEAASPGMTVRISGSQAGDEVFKVASTAVDDDGNSRLGLEGEAADALDVGSVVGAVILERTKSEVLAVPVSAIQIGPDGDEFIRVRDPLGGSDTVHVEVGFRGDELVEVLSDELEEGDEIALTS